MEDNLIILDAYLFLDLNKWTFEFDLEEMDSIISKKLRKDHLDKKICKRVEVLPIYLKFVGNFMIFRFGNHVNF